MGLSAPAPEVDVTDENAAGADVDANNNNNNGEATSPHGPAVDHEAHEEDLIAPPVGAPILRTGEVR
jgi:hypothetical protein